MEVCVAYEDANTHTHTICAPHIRIKINAPGCLPRAHQSSQHQVDNGFVVMFFVNLENLLATEALSPNRVISSARAYLYCLREEGRLVLTTMIIKR